MVQLKREQLARGSSQSVAPKVPAIRRTREPPRGTKPAKSQSKTVLKSRNRTRPRRYSSILSRERSHNKFSKIEVSAEEEPGCEKATAKREESRTPEDYNSESGDRQTEQSSRNSSKSGESRQRREQEAREDTHSCSEKGSDSKEKPAEVTKTLPSFDSSPLFFRKAGGAAARKPAQNNQNNRVQRQPNNKVQKRGSNQQGNNQNQKRNNQKTGGVSIKIKNRGPSG
jgi:hypothetical protein